MFLAIIQHNDKCGKHMKTELIMKKKKTKKKNTHTKGSAVLKQGTSVETLFQIFKDKHNIYDI